MLKNKPAILVRTQRYGFSQCPLDSTSVPGLAGQVHWHSALKYRVSCDFNFYKKNQHIFPQLSKDVRNAVTLLKPFPFTFKKCCENCQVDVLTSFTHSKNRNLKAIIKHFHKCARGAIGDL